MSRDEREYTVKWRLPRW